MIIHKSPNGTFSIRFPENWNLVEDDNVISLYDPENGVGSIQLSIYNVPDPENIVLKDELDDFLVDRHNNYDIIVRDNYVEAESIDVKENKYWKYWIFLKGDTLTFATYNCQEQDKEIEKNTVENIILSSF